VKRVCFWFSDNSEQNLDCFVFLLCSRSLVIDVCLFVCMMQGFSCVLERNEDIDVCVRLRVYFISWQPQCAVSAWYKGGRHCTLDYTYVLLLFLLAH
jgi:hypothetical protein